MSITKQDITTREDIILLVDSFYTKVIADKMIGHFFTRVVKISWEHHIPIMYDFWESVLLGTGKYKGNPVLKHVDIDQKEALHDDHFEQWQALFFETLDELFEGSKVAEAKTKTTSMRMLMQLKIDRSRNNPFFVQ